MYLSINDLSDLYDALDEAIESIGEGIDHAEKFLAEDGDEDISTVVEWRKKQASWQSLRTRVGGAMTEMIESSH